MLFFKLLHGILKNFMAWNEKIPSLYKYLFIDIHTFSLTVNIILNQNS